MDYFEESEEGCCLNCEDSYEGCLCYDCKCRKCSQYNDLTRTCDLADHFKAVSQKRKELLPFFVEILKETEKGLFVLLDKKKHWLPKSQIEIEEISENWVSKVYIPRWLVKDKEICENLSKETRPVQQKL